MSEIKYFKEGKKWLWKITAENHEQIAKSEQHFSSKQMAKKNINLVKEALTDEEISEDIIFYLVNGYIRDFIESSQSWHRQKAKMITKQIIDSGETDLNYCLKVVKDFVDDHLKKKNEQNNFTKNQ